MGNILYLAINLRRSEDRWTSIMTSGRQHGIDLRRVEAVDGRNYKEAEWYDFDVEKFEKCNGRTPLSGEFGCYQSHIQALRVFVESDADSAVILEDDAVINSKLKPFAQMLTDRHADKKYVVRLTAHRLPLFEKLQDGIDGHSIGQCWFGPTGSAAAYWLSRPAAKQLLKSMLPGYLPFDIMLERSWETGVTTVLIKPNLLPVPKPPYSEIRSTASSRNRKFPWYRRVSTLMFRTRQVFGRLFICLRTRSRDWNENVNLGRARVCDPESQ